MFAADTVKAPTEGRSSSSFEEDYCPSSTSSTTVVGFEPNNNNNNNNSRVQEEFRFSPLVHEYGSSSYEEPRIETGVVTHQALGSSHWDARLQSHDVEDQGWDDEDTSVVDEDRTTQSPSQGSCRRVRWPLIATTTVAPRAYGEYLGPSGQRGINAQPSFIGSTTSSLPNEGQACYDGDDVMYGGAVRTTGTIDDPQMPASLWSAPPQQSSIRCNELLSVLLNHYLTTSTILRRCMLLGGSPMMTSSSLPLLEAAIQPQQLWRERLPAHNNAAMVAANQGAIHTQNQVLPNAYCIAENDDYGEEEHGEGSETITTKAKRRAPHDSTSQNEGASSSSLSKRRRGSSPIYCQKNDLTSVKNGKDEEGKKSKEDHDIDMHHDVIHRNTSPVGSPEPVKENGNVLTLETLEDPMWFSPFTCFVRSKLLEVFEATETEAKTRRHRKDRQIVAGQVGFRCRYCSHLPSLKRKARSWAFPGSIHQMYQTIAMMIRDHFPICPCMPEKIKEEFWHLKSKQLKSKSRAGKDGSKYFWITSAKAIGLLDSARPVFGGVVLDHSKKDRFVVDLSFPNPSLLIPDDIEMMTGFLQLVLQQTKRIISNKTITKYRHHHFCSTSWMVEKERVGFACTHCIKSDDDDDGVGWFPTRNRESLPNIVKNEFVRHHLLQECPSCPQALKEELRREMEEEKKSYNRCQETYVFGRIWIRLAADNMMMKQ